MTMQEYIDEIRLEITGDVLELEIGDDILIKLVNKAFREVKRYIDITRLVTIPFARCINLADTELETSNIVKVYRSQSYISENNDNNLSHITDPMYAQRWATYGGMGLAMYNLSDYIMNFASWNSLLQIRNTYSTDLYFKQDLQDKKLYINVEDTPTKITIEYIPDFKNVEEITDPYWTDILVRLSIALTKLTLGRIRSRYTQSNALWQQDGDTLLAEANDELQTLRETLRVNNQISYPID